MKTRVLSCLLVPLFATASVIAQEEAPPPIPSGEAIKLGVDGIAEKRSDLSESGLGFAALFYAAAKRLETENALAAKDITLVVELERYREAMADWDEAWSGAMYAAAGGGTMWSHMASHKQASREDALALLAKRMPLKPGGATVEILSRWNTVGEAIEKAPVPESADEETKATWEQQRLSLHSIWERLSYEFQALEEADALLILEHVLPDSEQLDMLKGN